MDNIFWPNKTLNGKSTAHERLLKDLIKIKQRHFAGSPKITTFCLEIKILCFV